ncbi:hypothetical protein [Kibdelosporangium philippinense]
MPPAELAVVWRIGDKRTEIRTFVAACEQCLCAQPETERVRTTPSGPWNT